jgi:serine phosphatase RsbU (regulator of sigma subunit)
MKLKNFLLIFFLGMQILNANPIRIDGGKDSYTTAFHLKYFEDKNASLSWDDLAKPEIQNKFKDSETDSLGFGFTDSVFWVVIPYEANIDLTEYILEVDYPLIDKIEFVYKNTEGKTINKKAGRGYLFPEREFLHRNFLFSMKDLNKAGKLYFRFQTESSMQLRVIIHKQKKFWEKEQVELGFQIIFLGIIGSMLFYNLLLGISLRDSTYFYYLFYLISAGLFISGLKGLNYQFLWGNFIAWNHLSGPVLLALTNLGILLFANSFLKLKENLPYLYKVFFILIIISCVCLFSSFLISYRVIARILVFLVLVNSLASIFAGSIIASRGYRPAKIYLVAWGILLLGAFLLALSRLGLISLTFVSENTAQIGVALESILLSFALADRIKILQLEKENAQLESIVSMKKALRVESQLGAYQHELELARKIQQSIIPRMTPKIDGLVIAAWYKPMESIGGDFYDFHQSGENLGFIMADVSGHGVPAALIVSTLKTAFWFQEHNLRLPENLLLSMNEILKGKAGNEFVTACYGYIDLKNRVLKTSNAGHSDLLIYRHSEGNIISLNPKGAALCIFPNPVFGSQEIQLEKGDRILLYTDGLFEVSNNSEELFGEERLCKILKENTQLPAIEFGDLLLQAVMNWSKNKEQLDDDIALIVIDIVA